ncbi:MAG: tRNA (adenosine(37)-N6)-threonylcarbamoyltransferase complex dimerization subunit type 1 TsaB [Planctomycetota bacterium]
MRTIAIDTSLAAGSVAAVDGPARATRGLGPAGEHARLLAAAIAEVAAELGWTPADAQLVAVVRGPGSFTGLRVGVATAKAIAWAGGARLLGVSGFEVVAEETARIASANGADHRGPLAIAYDAGRGEVFAAVAEPMDAGGWQVGPGALVAADRWIESLPDGCLVTGPALDTLATQVAAAGHRLAPEPAWQPSAIAAALLAIPRAAAGAADSPETLVPEYLRPSYADERAG